MQSKPGAALELIIPIISCKIRIELKAIACVSGVWQAVMKSQAPCQQATNGFLHQPNSRGQASNKTLHVDHHITQGHVAMGLPAETLNRDHHIMQSHESYLVPVSAPISCGRLSTSQTSGSYAEHERAFNLKQRATCLIGRRSQLHLGVLLVCPGVFYK